MRTSFEAVSAKALDSNELTLTCKGMSSVNWDCSDADFEFLFGEDKVCRVHSVLAEFLSPKVARLRKCDPLCNVYTFNDSEIFSVFERLILSLRSGEALRVEKSNFAALLSLSQELENSELLSSLLGMLKTESLSLEEAILLLRVGIDLGTAFSGRFGNLRDYVASRFHEIEEEILDNLDIETAQILLSSPSLQIEDEDSLYDFVRSRAESDLSFTSLFELVYFEYLSVDRIENFASFVSENLLENINSGIWRQICRRLILETKPNEKNPHVSKDKQDTGKKMTKPGIEFVYDSSKQLEGIIAHLTKQCGGNVHDKGIVNATASSGGERAKYAADLGTTATYQSDLNQEGAWICYEFKERRVIPTSYSVGTYDATANPKSWVIEVSNDGTHNSWTEIDRRENDNDLKNPNVVANFKISRVPSDGFRFFRLRQIGKDHADMNYLTIRALEIFGTLFEE